ncbi:MAG TPA: FliH/SctL family protein [Candidatus Baltobacteraceae bacterium]|nr:FliH/SctL family protein [Candidatus Baltobacteraceae bacterium]
MPDPRFVSFAELLRASSAEVSSSPIQLDDIPLITAIPATTTTAPTPVNDNNDSIPTHPFIVEFALARALVYESYERSRVSLLEQLADAVLGRELTLEPIEINELAQRIWESARDAEPIVLRVHPDDAVALDATELPVRSDRSLQRGDLVLELRDGEIDARYAVRRADVIFEVMR